MGRYYKGDIEGKFWFGTQSSNDADFFGVKGTVPDMLNYYFSEEDLSKVEEGIAQCEKELGQYRVILDRFFETNNSYNDTILAKTLDINESSVQPIKTWYVRLLLGIKIRDCIKEKGQCEFEAEL